MFKKFFILFLFFINITKIYCDLIDGYTPIVQDLNSNTTYYLVYTKAPDGGSIIKKINIDALNNIYTETYVIGKSTNIVNYNNRASLTYYPANIAPLNQYN